MLRQVVKKLGHWVQRRRHTWYLRMFGEHFTDPHRLWSLNRHSITKGFGAGIAISFVPLPVHLLLVVISSLWWRLNVAAAVAGSYLVNPFTVVPVYYAAYRLGALVLRHRPQKSFEFHPSWHWLEHGLGPAWKPFLLGCLICGIVCGLLGRFGLEYSWRIWAMRRYRRRRQRCQANIKP